MRGLSSILAVVALSVACGAMRENGRSSERSAPTSSDGASPLQGAALVIDVRTPEETADGYLDGAMLLPLAELPERIPEVEAAVGGDKSQKIVTYCRTGNRAGQAKAVLDAHGFTNVVNGGGYDDLRRRPAHE